MADYYGRDCVHKNSDKQKETRQQYFKTAFKYLFIFYAEILKHI